jgi:ATP-dependent Lhr-like helicase
VIGWGRISPHPAWTAKDAAAPRRVIPTNAAPITFYLRESSEWFHDALAAKCVDEDVLAQSLSAEAQQVRSLLAQQGACFTADLQRLTGLTKLQTTTALWELATAGLAAADGFDQLRSMMDPRRKAAVVAQTSTVSLRKRAAARTTAGRWSLLVVGDVEAKLATTPAEKQAAAIAAARQREAALDAHARILLCRYGVLFRELLTRESNAPKWRDLVPVLRRLEARGEIRSGRFVSGPFGEQYALPEVAESLRKARTQQASRAGEAAIAVAGADALNLAGILVPGERVAAVPGQTVAFVNGAVQQEETMETMLVEPRKKVSRSRSLAELLRAEAMPLRAAQQPVSQDLFS